jgi:hypothetical protein
MKTQREGARPSVRRCLTHDEEFRRATIDANLIVENFGVVPAETGEAVGREMAMYMEAVKKLGSARTRSRGAPTTAADSGGPGRLGASDDAAHHVGVFCPSPGGSPVTSIHDDAGTARS